jgi:hypothetical protein
MGTPRSTTTCGGHWSPWCTARPKTTDGRDRPGPTCQELLARQLTHETRVRVSASTVARTLAELGARWGMARPTVECPWAPAVKRARVRAIEQLVAPLPAEEEAFYKDEVDIHLNARIGRDWMLPGEQKTVLTPGKNEKHYLAGALHTRTGDVFWVGNFGNARGSLQGGNDNHSDRGIDR